MSLSLGLARRRSPAALPSLSYVFGVWQQRRALARLDDAALCDLGLTRKEALAEASRPLWDLPHA